MTNSYPYGLAPSVLHPFLAACTVRPMFTVRYPFARGRHKDDSLNILYQLAAIYHKQIIFDLAIDDTLSILPKFS
jgi:hypothetical protein